MKMEWKEPPESGNQFRRRKRWLNELRKFPGRWARYPHQYTGNSPGTQLRKANPDFEFSTVKVENGMIELYGRYMPDKDTHADT